MQLIPNQQKQPRQISRLLLAAIAGAVFLLASLIWVAQARGDGQELPAADGRAALDAAWQRAQRAERYQFTADVTENNVPLATFSNVGRSSQATHYYMAGESQPGAGALNMTLWANGGSVLDPASGISVRAADGRVEARPGAGGAWQTIDSFGSLFAPAGDFMSFLVAATDIRVQTAANGLLSYSFTIDGPRFAEFMRQELQTQMIASGELLPGMTLQTPAIYAGMTGSGVLWLDAAGLPSRQEIHLTLPAEASRQADTRLTVDSVVTFTDYSFAPQRAGVGAWLRSLPAARLFGAGRLADIEAVILPASLFLVAIAWLARLLWRSRPTVAYRFFAILLVTIMLLTPLFQGAQIARAATLRLLRQESRAAQQEDSAMQRALADWREEAAASTIPAGALDRIRADDGTDSDGDGLSDVVEWLQDEGTLAQEEGWAELLLDLGCVTIVDDGYTTDDADGDGLTDYEECLLGTSSATSTLRDGLTPDGRDSDGDSLPDLWEVTGYAYAGEHWYPDPLAADSNFDALPDTLEWEFDANGDGEADDSDGDGIPDMRDTDLDGIPDLFDRDNDGDGVPDRLDSSPFTASARPLYDSAGQLTGYDGRLFDDSNPLALQLNDLSSDKLTFVEFQLRPTDPDHLWYARNVLDWPQYDRRGQMQDDDNLTFLDIAEPGRAAANDGNGDIRLVPMLEIYIPGPASGLPDNALLDQYGISIQPAEAGVYAYVPVYVVADDAGGANVAFFAKMLYLPGAGWAAAHEINLVWMVQALVDRCASYEYVDSEGETQQSSDCQSYSAHNEVEVIHVYENDPWYLTGLNVREEHGVDFAIIYEDPAVDTDVNDDEALIQLAQGFDYSLLIGRDCGSGDNCVADGQRDISVATIYDRWNRTTNGAVSDDERWGIDNILRVQEASFGNIDEALATIAMTTTVALLNSNFGVPPTTAITPTLLFAREERYRAASLDNLGTALFWTGSHLDVNMDPARVTLDVLAGVNWAMYTQGDDGWASLAADAVWDELARRYDGAFGNEEQAVAEGMLVGVQLFYSSLLVGVNRIVETDGRLLPAAPSLYLPDKPLAASVLKGVGSAANLIVARFLLAGLDAIKPAAYNTFFRYLRDVFFHTFFETVASPLSGLMVKINKLTKLTGWKLGVGTGAIIAGTLLIVGLAVGLAFALGDDDVGRAVLAGVVGLVLAAVMLVGPINELAAALKGTDGIAKTLSRLGGLTRLSTASRAAGAIGLIISIGVPIGVFIYQWVEGGLTAGSPEFNYLLAYTIAAVALAILLFVLSLTIVGAIIVALLAIVDIILLIAGVDFSVTTWLTEKLTDNYYTYNQIFDSDINLGSLDMSLDNPERGLGQGATFSYQADITTTLVMTDPSWQASFYVGTVFFNEDDFDDAVFVYSLEPFNEVFTEEEIAAGSSVWTISPDGSYGLFDLYRGETYDQVSVSGVGVPVGINQSPTFYLNSGYDTPAYECWGQNILTVCYTESLTGTNYVNLGDNLFYDVFPATLSQFVALDWAGDYQAFPPQIDRDGDGQPANGLDPDDTTWDVDGDGLPDGYELALRGYSREDGGTPISYLSRDTDGDGLCDGDEIRAGTDPAGRDTDGDGLTDAEEIWHQDCASGAWTGGWMFTYALAADTGDGQDHSRRIFSDPLKADADGDGFSDKVEMLIHLADPATFPFHPDVYNDSPGGLYPETNEVDGVLAPGQTLAYTLTVRNNFPQPYWVYGGVTVTVPALLGGGVFNEVSYDPDGPGGEDPITDTIFNLYPDNRATLARQLQVDAGAGSVEVSIANDLRAQLNGNGDISYDWVLDRTALTWDQSPAGYLPFAMDLAATPAGTGWGTPFVAAVIEADDLIDPLEFEVVLYELDDGVADRTVLHSFTMEPDDLDGYGTPTAAVVCADDGHCLVVYSYFEIDSDANLEGMQIGGVQVAPAGVVAGTRFSIGQLADTDTSYNNDVRLPVAATDGSRFWLAYTAESYTLPSPEWLHPLLARRVNDNGSLGPVHRIDQQDLGANSIEASLDIAWMGGEQLILTWSTPAGDYNNIHKALLAADASLVPGSYALVATQGETPQIAYEPGIGRGLLVYRQHGPNGQRIRAYFVEAGTIGSGFQPAGGPDPDDVVHSPTVAYDHFNEGWIVAWLGQTGNAATLYYTSYNGADSQARLVRQAVPLSGILPPAGLTAACQPQPAVTNLTDCRVGGHETAANTGSGALFWQEVVLEYDSPFYGAYNNETTLPLIIDADAPDSHFVNLPAYVRPDELIIIGGEATDPTSSVARVEISVNGGPFEPAAEGASAASWVYALATGPAGILNLAIRAVDAAENIQVGLTTATIIVDGAPPEVNVSLNNGAIVAPVEEADGAWILPLSGTVTDPTVSGQPGSGVASLAISLSPAGSLGGAWVPLTWAGAGAWQVDYPLADAATNRTPYDLTGSYDLRVRATDQLGQTREALLATIGLDNRPPQATLDLIAGTEVTVTTLVTAHPLLAGTFITTQIGIPTVITQTVPFSGRVYELGPVTSGINELAYSFTPFDFLTSPFPETAPANPFWLTAPLTVISATLSGWEATVPEGLEGFFSIDLRAVDGLGNVEEAPASYRQWLGEIDTNTPRVAVDVNFAGWDLTARTEYALTVTDLNLVEEGFTFAVCLPPGQEVSGVERLYYSSAWADAFLPEQRLAGLNVSCLLPGLNTQAFRVQACDAFGHCTGQDFDPDFNLYVAGNSETLTRTNSLGAAAETAALLAGFNRPVYSIDDGQLTYVLHNDTPAAAVYQSNLDGSDNQLLAQLRPGTGSADVLPLSADDGHFTDDFGAAVALSADGNTLVIADDSPVDPGLDGAYVFERSGAGWIQTATLNYELDDGDNLAFLDAADDVAINADGSIIVLGTTAYDTGGATSAGAVIVYERPGGNWGSGAPVNFPAPVARLVASDAASNGRLGNSVAINGNLIVASPLGGAVTYLFVEPGGGWVSGTESVQLALPAGGLEHEVASAGNWLAVAHSTAVYVYHWDGANWLLDTTLVGATGPALALSEDTLIAGNRVYVHDGSSWLLQATLPVLADSASLAGDLAILGDTAGGVAGQAHVFLRLSGAWVRQLTLSPADGAAGDAFGSGVAVVGDTVVVGAPDGGVVGEGRVYLHQVGLEGLVLPPPTAENQGAHYGRALAIDGDTMVVGAPLGQRPGTIDVNGVATVFVRRDNVWYPEQTLFAADGQSADQFGAAVAIQGDTIVVGAPQALDNGVRKGAVYFFTRSGGVWTEQDKALNGRSDPGQFGLSIAFAGATTVVGAPGNNGGEGQVYLYARSGNSWSYQATLVSTDALGGATDGFGHEVAAEGDLIAVSSNGAATGFVFVRPGSGWTSATETARLQVAGAGLSQVALSGDLIAVAGDGVHLFTPSGAGWSGTLAPQRSFVYANVRDLALAGDQLVVATIGELFVHVRDGDGVWSSAAPLAANAPFSVDFGRQVASSAGTIIAADESLQGGTGAVYAFDTVSVSAVSSAAGATVWAEATRAGQAIRRHDGGAAPWQSVPLVGPTPDQRYVDLVVNEAGTLLYWSEYDVAAPAQGRVLRATVAHGSNVTIIVPTGPRPHGLALNELAGTLYWTTDNEGSIYEADLDGGGAAALYTGLAGPTDLALLPAETALYWVEPAGGATVWRGQLNGGSPTPVYTLTTTLAGIAVDQNYLPVAVDQNLTTPLNEPLFITLDDYDPDGDSLTYTILAGPANGQLQGALPAAYYVPDDDYSGPDSFTYQAADGRGGTAQAVVSIAVGGSVPALGVTRTFTEGTNLIINMPSLADYTPPPSDSVIFTPASGAVITSAGTITVSGAAYAFNGLQGLAFYVDGSLTEALPYNGVITRTNWAVAWTPAGDGLYELVTQAEESGAGLEAELTPVTVIVDTAPPSITIDSLNLTRDQLLAGALLEITGMASDAAGVVAVALSYELPGGGFSDWLPAAYDATTGQWRYELAAGSLIERSQLVLRARATDYAGNVTLFSDLAELDLVPPAEVTLTVSHNGTPLAPGDLVSAPQATMTVNWTASSDASDPISYEVGLSASADPALPWLASASHSGAGQQAFLVAEAQALYVHLRLTDFPGNQRTQTVGPFFVDGPLTPDLIQDLGYAGWQASGNSLLSADYASRNATASQAALHQPQQLYGSWNENALRLTWQGADWDSHGDLFIYLDSAPGGATVAYDPFVPAGPPLSMPGGFGADYLVHVASSSAATLQSWNGSSWALVQELDSAAFRVTGPARLDLLLPFNLLGISDPAGSSLALLALATEEGALRTWAAAPDQNPLNSDRVIGSLAAGHTADGYALTQVIAWPSLGSGVAPNGGLQPGSDLQVTLQVTPAGPGVGYLASDWLDLLLPGGRLDADLDGELDLPLPLAPAPLPLGNGVGVSYAVHIVNDGDEPANGVTVAFTPYGALTLATANPVLVGTLAPGEQITVTIAGVINTALAGNAAELAGVISDDRHGPFEWVWAHHPVDREPPAGLALTAPVEYVQPFVNTIAGVVDDPAGVPTIDILIRPIPGDEEGFASCTDPTPYDGVFNCPLDLGELAGKTAVDLRVRATDSYGHTSAWTPYQRFALDRTAPELSLLTDLDLLLQDGFLSEDEGLWAGLLTDDRAPAGVTACLDGACRQGAAPLGNWQLALPLPEADGVSATVIITGTDAAGNASQPLTRTVIVDTVPPVLTVATRVRETPLTGAQPLVVLAGSYADGGGVAEIYARLQGPAGDFWTTAERQNGQWTLALALETVGAYQITLQVYDRAGNGRDYGPFPLTVTLHKRYLPVVVHDAAGPTAAVGQPAAPADLAGNGAATVGVVAIRPAAVWLRERRWRVMAGAG